VGEHKGAVQGLDRSHGRVELAQELFNRQKTVLVFECQGLGDPFLMIKSETVILSRRLPVKVIPDKMDESEVAFQVRIFFVGKHSRVLEVLRRSDVEKGLGKPEKMMVVSQAADSLFEVGFEQGACIPEHVHAHLILFLKPSAQGQSFLGKNSLLDPLHEREVKGGLTTKEAGIHQGGEGFEVFTRKAETVLDASDPVSQVKT